MKIKQRRKSFNDAAERIQNQANLSQNKDKRGPKKKIANKSKQTTKIVEQSKQNEVANIADSTARVVSFSHIFINSSFDKNGCHFCFLMLRKNSRYRSEG